MTVARKTLRRLPSLKGFPEQLRPTLECVCSVEHLNEAQRWGALRKCLVPKLLELPGRPKRQPSNLISAQALPTANRLGLIEGRKASWRSTYYGRRLNEVARDPTQFRLRLGKRLLEIDRTEWKVIEAGKSAEEYPAQRVPLSSLALALATRGVDACEDLRPQPDEVARRLTDAGVTWTTKASRLSDMLQFFNYTDIIRFEKRYVTVLSSRMIEIEKVELQRPESTVSLEEFEDELVSSYESLSGKVFRSPYVPIKGPLMESVCERLRVDDAHFTRLLLALPNTLQKWQILLSPYRTRLPAHEVIQVGRQQYYFISIYPASDVQEAGSR